MASRDDFLFTNELSDFDPAVAHLIELEKERQVRKLNMIPSESGAPGAVREALASEFMNVYAEGYPNPETRWLNEEEILDYEHYLAHYKRYGDRRHYRGAEYVDVIEALARRRCAQAFETSTIPADQIYVNVQPLSGAPANMAAQQALLKPGDTIMGLSLVHGGHLTHGGRVNVSGRLYNVVHYTVNEQTELLDYDEIEELALEHRPRIIIAGYTAYPRQPNWLKFRQIADRIGAYLLADIAHVAGMVIGGAFPSPVPYADVVTFTTHKTLAGPRGGCILTTSPELAGKIDRAVYPGVQAGPHANNFAAMAVAFQLARTEQFRLLQQQIVVNARALARALADCGLRVPCGGTDTHLLLLDCTTVTGRDGVPLKGGPTATILDMIGIVVNKNTIPGDREGDDPSGIRMGTPWVTQRGLREPEMEQIASVIHRALQAIEPFAYSYVSGPAYRGKITFDAMEELRLEVADMADAAEIDFEPPCSGYPHHCLVPELRVREELYAQIELEGNDAASFVEKVTPTDLDDLSQEEWRPIALLAPDGAVMSPAAIQRTRFGWNRYRLIVPAARARRVIAWLRHLSDGHVLFDHQDVKAKLPGPVVVRDLGAADRVVSEHDLDLKERGLTPAVSHKPYFIGLSGEQYQEPEDQALPPFDFSVFESEEGHSSLKKSVLHDWHVGQGARMAPFAGYEMPLWYTSIGDEHRAVRGAAGLFDLSHMGMLDVRRPHAGYFLNLVTTNDVTALRPIHFGPGEAEPGQAHYTFLLDPDGHVIDDLIVYRLSPARYLLVVNASNAGKDWAWLNAVNAGEVQVDRARPWVRPSFQTELRNLHDPEESYAWLVNLAIQGPRSRDILLALIDAAPASAVVTELRRRLLMMTWMGIIEARIPSQRAPGGMYDLFIAQSGYTGQSTGFEIFAHPEVAEPLWTQLLEVGAPFGLRPVGLGARDSLRIEAGLPLYGRELAGPLDLVPQDAGLEGYLKLHKPFFVGRGPVVRRAKQRKMEIARFRVEQRGVRVPKQGDAVTESRGRVIGQVTSCAQDTEGFLVGLAYVDQRYTAIGTQLGIFPRPSRGVGEKRYEELEVGDRVTMHLEAQVIPRFMQ